MTRHAGMRASLLRNINAGDLALRRRVETEQMAALAQGAGQEILRSY